MAKFTGQPCGWVNACPVTPLPFEDHPSTQACQTGLRKKPQEKQTFESLAMIDCYFIGVAIE